jgi:hypothetical protein
MYSALVIGRDINAERDLVNINLESLWFLFNILRALARNRKRMTFSVDIKIFPPPLTHETFLSVLCHFV